MTADPLSGLAWYMPPPSLFNPCWLENVAVAVLAERLGQPVAVGPLMVRWPRRKTIRAYRSASRPGRFLPRSNWCWPVLTSR